MSLGAPRHVGGKEEPPLQLMHSAKSGECEYGEDSTAGRRSSRTETIIEDLRTENDELQLKVRVLERILGEVGQDAEVDTQTSGGERAVRVKMQSVLCRRRFMRLLWQKAIHAVRAQNSQARQSALKLRLCQAEAKAKEAEVKAEEAARKPFELLPVKAKEGRKRLANWQDEELACSSGCSSQIGLGEMAAAEWSMSGEGSVSQGVSVGENMSQLMSLEVAYAGAKSHREPRARSQERAARGSRDTLGDPALRHAIATVETQKDLISELWSHARALESQVATDQAELNQLRQLASIASTPWWGRFCLTSRGDAAPGPGRASRSCAREPQIELLGRPCASQIESMESIAET